MYLTNLLVNQFTIAHLEMLKENTSKSPMSRLHTHIETSR